jgi:regulator of sigma E protease
MWIVGFLAVLGPLVTVHELGHYLVGRWFGVKADAFSIGFGKELAGYTDKRGTRWKISALPLGGYVQFAGDMNPASQPTEEWLALPREEREQCFQAKPLWQKALIVAAGPITNFLVAIAILASFNYAYGRMQIAPVVAVIEQGGAAEQAGLRLGDRIVAVNGREIASFDEIRNYIAPYPGDPIHILAQRGDERLDFRFIIPVTTETDNFGNQFRIGRIGVGSAPDQFEIIPLGPVASVGAAFRQTGDIVAMMVTGIRQIITGQRSVDELGGPIKIAKFSGEQLSLGWRDFAGFVALISINLAFINLLPIPALDGGHLVFYLAEAIRRKPASPRSQEWAYKTGIAFVLALMVFVTVNDIASLPVFGG